MFVSNYYCNIFKSALDYFSSPEGFRRHELPGSLICVLNITILQAINKNKISSIIFIPLKSLISQGTTPSFRLSLFEHIFLVRRCVLSNTIPTNGRHV